MSLNDLALCALTFRDVAPEAALGEALPGATRRMMGLAPVSFWLSH